METHESLLSLNEKPLSAVKLNKIWEAQELEDGTLIITSYKGEERDVVIPSLIDKKKVTAIDSNTFNPNASGLNDIQQEIRKGIASVTFPGTIHEIPEDMFRCYPFGGRQVLKRILLSEGIAKLCNRAFFGCEGVEEIIIPESVREIGVFAFQNCTNLRRITLPSHMAVLSRGIFSNTGFESFVVDNRFTKIEESVFDGCEKLKSIKLPDAMTEIPAKMFAGCKSLQTFVFPSNVTSIGKRAFARSGLIECDMPDSVKSIGVEAFSECKSLMSIKVPKDVTIGDAAFSGCDALADENGAVTVGKVLCGFLKPKGYWSLPPELQIKPLILEDEDVKVSVPISELPQIVCRKYDGEGSAIDIDSISVGDSIEFGRFPADDDYAMHPIKWLALAKENGKVLLITIDEIISLDYEIRQVDVWADSYVREMLNDGFINVAFTEKERAQIAAVTINTPKNKKCKTDGGPDTVDKVFLLSVEEVKKYFPTEESRKSKPTKYAYKQRSAKRDVGFWQLRTPGKDGWGSVAVSASFGDISHMDGNHVGYSFIRPVIWIKND